MSRIYAKNNFEKTSDLFRKRLTYRRKAKSSTGYASNMVNFTIGEKKLYGKVDSFFAPIFVKHASNLKPLRNSDTDNPAYAFNFVADLFNEMVIEFERCVASGQISKDDPYLSSLKVYKGYEDPTLAYNNYQNILFTQVKQRFIQNNILVEDFEHFLEQFSKIVRSMSTSTPYTMSAFVKSDLNPVLGSGLALEIADLDYANDREKVEVFLKSKNWKFFVNACNKYGFIIDHNIPWRIICDIKAPDIKPAMGQYFSTVETLFYMGFHPASIESFTRMPADLLRLYNQVKRKRFKKQIICNKKVINRVIIPPTYTRQQIIEQYGLTYFAKLYMNIRLSEEKPELSIYDRARFINDVLRYIDSTGDYLAIHNYFEKFINKPFDKRYSHTYNRNIRHPAIKPILEGRTIGASEVRQTMMSY